MLKKGVGGEIGVRCKGGRIVRGHGGGGEGVILWSELKS